MHKLRPQLRHVIKIHSRRCRSARTTETCHPPDPFISTCGDTQSRKRHVEDEHNLEKHVAGSQQRLRVAVKDNICTKDLPSTCGSQALETFRSPCNATVIDLLEAAGHDVVGKTNMDEFGMGSYSTNSHFGIVRQEHEGIPYSVGGSSGGSAIAVKNDLADIALGTDTGGSVRQPAAWCGVLGFKPSYGMISRWGVVDYANSFDTVGLLAKGVNVIRTTFDLLSQPDPKDPTCLAEASRERIARHSQGIGLAKRRLRFGIPLECNIAELSPIVRMAWLDTIKTLQKDGHTVMSVSLPLIRSALSAYYVLAPAEASSNLARYDGVRFGARAKGEDGVGGILFARTRSQFFGEEVKRRILLGSYTLSAGAIDNYFIQAQRVRRMVQEDFNKVFQLPHPLQDDGVLETSSNRDGQVDVLLCPTAPTPPPSLAELDKQASVERFTTDVFTVPASMAGLPAISFPWKIGQGPEERVGLQIIGQYGQDKAVLHLAEMLVGRT